ncbi:MAG TPA: OmpH family outer membrane protein [Bacteroidales bacterium]|nr:OmpH family outer membrane protein [Bacteroidales bacterium]
MKNLFKAVAVVILFAAFVPAQAQKNVKLGHVDFGKVIEQMPGQDTVKKVMEDYTKSLRDQLQTMQTELETKYADYLNNQATFSALIKTTKEKEISDLQDRIQGFQQQAQQDISDQETKLTTPFIEKAKKAINDVAKENGFTYIFNNVEGFMLYTDGGEDVTPLVKKKLGITQ